MKKYSSIALLGLIFVCPLNAQTLKEAVKYSLATEPDLAATIHNKQAVEQEVFQAYSGYLPSFSIAVDYGNEKSSNSSTRALTAAPVSLKKTSLGLTAAQSLFNGFSTYNSVQQSLYKAQSSAYGVQNSLEGSALNAITVYLDVLEKQKLVALAEDNLKEHQELLSKIERRAQSGIGRYADLDQAEGRFALARSNYLSQKANLQDAKTYYQRVIGITPQNLQIPLVDENKLPKTEESAVSVALSEHPSIRSAMMSTSSASAAYRASFGAFLPSVSLQLVKRRDNNLGGVVGQTQSDAAVVSVNYTPFNGGSDKSKVIQLSEQWQSAKESRTLTMKKIEAQVRVSWNLAITASQQAKYYADEVEAMIKTKDAYQKQFAIGQRTLVDLLGAEDELFRARTDLASTEFKKLKGQYQLLGSMGSLLPALQLEVPPEAQYRDPGILGAVVRSFF